MNKIIPIRAAIGGTAPRTFELSRVKCCPHCGQAFPTYQKIGSNYRPMQVDPMPHHGLGTRETCGDPQCWDAEDLMQWRIRVQWRQSLPQKSKPVAWQENLL